MSTPRSKLFILSAGLFTIALETADQELYPHPYGFTSSSPPRPSLPHLSPSLSLPWFVRPPHSYFQIYLISSFFSFVFFPLTLFSLSVLLISPKLPLTHFLFRSFHVFPLADILSSATPVLLTKILMCWLCRMFMFVSLKSAPVASWKTAIILVSRQRLFSVPCARGSIPPHACVRMISSDCSV